MSWSFEMEKTLFDELAKWKGLGKQAGTGWKDEIWVPVISAIKVFTPDADKPLVEKSRIKSKIENMKKLWKAWVTMLDLSGWTVDSITGLPKNDRKVMDDYFAKHKTARYFKTKPLPFKDILYYLWEGKTATGRRAGGIRATIDEAAGNAVVEVGESSSTDENRKRQSETPGLTGGRKYQRQNEREVLGLREELKRGNDILMAQMAERRDPIKAAIAAFDERYAAGFDMATQVRVMSFLQKANNAIVFVTSPDARQKALLEAWLAAGSGE